MPVKLTLVMVRVLLLPHPVKQPLPDRVRVPVPEEEPVTGILPETVTLQPEIPKVKVPVPEKFPRVTSAPLAVMVEVKVGGQQALL